MAERMSEAQEVARLTDEHFADLISTPLVNFHAGNLLQLKREARLARESEARLLEGVEAIRDSLREHLDIPPEAFLEDIGRLSVRIPANLVLALLKAKP